MLSEKLEKQSNPDPRLIKSWNAMKALLQAKEEASSSDFSDDDSNVVYSSEEEVVSGVNDAAAENAPIYTESSK